MWKFRDLMIRFGDMNTTRFQFTLLFRISTFYNRPDLLGGNMVPGRSSDSDSGKTYVYCRNKSFLLSVKGFH